MELTDLASFERLTGRAFFTPAGATSALHLANIEMLRSDYGLKSFDVLRSRRGQVYPRKRVVFGKLQTFSLQINQFTSATQFIHLAGTRQADLVQVATSAQIFVFTAAPGGWWSLGHSEIFLRSVMAGGGSPKIRDYDFFLDDQNGWIGLPSQGGTITPGQVVNVTYDFPELALEAYNALDSLSRDGQLVVYCEDEFGPPAREKWVMDVTLICKGMPDTDPSKFRSSTLEALVYEARVFKRPQPRAYGEIITGTGSVLDLS